MMEHAGQEVYLYAGRVHFKDRTQTPMIWSLDLGAPSRSQMRHDIMPLMPLTIAHQNAIESKDQTTTGTGKQSLRSCRFAP